ncbi:MAG TPA: type III glutamate--ammonia ligase [Opitutaceae bacterium]|jgi:glutamine synthetase|nr:type III glutamate--ammonia ligase [Opitutaceae bacterium]
MSSPASLASQLEKDKVSFLLAQFVDIHGSPKVKMAPVESLDSLIEEGAGFAGGAVWGMGQGAHSHDMMGRIDTDTYTPLPWQPDVARFASDIYVDGEPYPFCSRVNLKRQLDAAKAKGFVMNIGIEPEHFLVVKKPDGSIAPWDPANVDSLAKPCYDFKAVGPALGYLQDITRYCNSLGWGVYQTDHEDGNGQYEVNFKYTDALTTADRYTFFKMMTSQVALKYGAVATHMPKPFTNRTGSGAHIHYHVADAATGKNLFTDESDPRGLGLSKMAYHFLGGIIHHAPALCAITSPTINCYKRLLVGDGLHSTRSGFTWTPAFISYGDNNRTQMLRVCGPGHVEDRSVSAGCNPYLAFAAYVAAGLDGVAKSMDPGEPSLKNLYAMTPEQIAKLGLRTLPQSLRESITALEADDVVRASLGPIADEFIKLKRQEWNEYHRQVSPWEIDQYLSLF